MNGWPVFLTRRFPTVMPREAAPLVALLTDFGTRDWYVASLKGVLLSRAPGVQVLDITHEIAPQDIIAGSLTLAAVAPWLPHGTVCLAVVDPGVGTNRSLLAAEADGRSFVGPDNGLLELTLRRARRWRAVRLTERRYWLPGVSRTFESRDILAPVAAHLARGGSLARLGPAMTRLVPAITLPARRVRGGVQGRVIHVDAFGNVVTSLEASRWLRGARGAAEVRCRRRRAAVVSSYADGRPRQLVAVVNSLGLIELAIPNGSAARALRARRGDHVALVPVA